jgi:sugar lactone lactonase YvrE
MIGTKALLLLAVLLSNMVAAHVGTGIVVRKDGAVYFVHGIRDRIMRYKDGKVTEFAHAAGSLGQVPHHLMIYKGELMTCGDRDGQVCRISSTGKVAAYGKKPKDMQLGDGGDPIAIAPNGDIIGWRETQWKRSEIVRVDKTGKVTVLAGGVWGQKDGKGTAAQFASLHGSNFVWGKDRSLYLADNDTTIRKVAMDRTVTTFASGFRGARGMVFDAAGNLYVADDQDRLIKKVTPKGAVTTVATGFSEPAGVAMGPNGSIYVLDWERDDPILKSITSSGKVTTLATVKKRTAKLVGYSPNSNHRDSSSVISIPSDETTPRTSSGLAQPQRAKTGNGWCRVHASASGAGWTPFLRASSSSRAFRR